MDEIFFKDSLKKIVDLKLLKLRSIDNGVFRLHYLFTAPLLFVLSIAVTLTQYFGDPINCIQGDDIPEKVINTYCWIESTFSLPKSLNKKVGEEVVYPGVERYQRGDEVIEHAYYQWVFIVLLLQGLMFYVTRTIWTVWEGGKVNDLLMGLNKPLMDSKKIEAKSNALASYFCENLRCHNGYAIKYFICEILNLINVVGQVCLIDRFLGGEFTTYGYKVFQFMRMDQQNRIDPMIRVFPRVAKCTFHKFGSAGSVQTHDSLCILPLNIVNEKIYVFLWVWLLILAVLSGLAVLYSLFVMKFSSLRAYVLKKRNKLVKSKHIRKAKEHLSYGDWFLLHLLSKNIHSLNFSKFMEVLHDKLYNEQYNELKDFQPDPKFNFPMKP